MARLLAGGKLSLKNPDILVGNKADAIEGASSSPLVLLASGVPKLQSRDADAGPPAVDIEDQMPACNALQARFGGRTEKAHMRGRRRGPLRTA
jgi:hypothetical protein